MKHKLQRNLLDESDKFLGISLVFWIMIKYINITQSIKNNNNQEWLSLRKVMTTRAESKNLLLFCTIQYCLRIQNKFNKLFILEVKK